MTRPLQIKLPAKKRNIITNQKGIMNETICKYNEIIASIPTNREVPLLKSVGTLFVVLSVIMATHCAGASKKERQTQIPTNS